MKILFVCIFTLASTFAMASSPVSMTRFSKVLETIVYKVKCDNGREVWISSREGEWPKRQWCVGLFTTDRCEVGLFTTDQCEIGRVKVKVAKLACNAPKE